jgi:hypothetical protein
MTINPMPNSTKANDDFWIAIDNTHHYITQLRIYLYLNLHMKGLLGSDDSAAITVPNHGRGHRLNSTHSVKME